MGQRNILLVVRNDILTNVRDGLLAIDGVEPTNIPNATKLRRSGDAPGTTSHRVAHGRISDTIWAELFDVLDVATQGIRDAVDWQGKPSTAVADARWVVATEAGDIVAAFRLTTDGATVYENARAALATAGLVFSWVDS